MRPILEWSQTDRVFSEMNPGAREKELGGKGREREFRPGLNSNLGFRPSSNKNFKGRLYEDQGLKLDIFAIEVLVVICAKKRVDARGKLKIFRAKASFPADAQVDSTRYIFRQ